MKKIMMISLAIGIATLSVTAQKYMTKQGHIKFYSHTPMEDIEANNYQVMSIVDVSTGDMVFSLLIKGFNFEKALMQEHFNEKYMESDKFPKAEFKGVITNISELNLKSEDEQEAKVEGSLTIHGVTKKVVTTGTLQFKDGKLLANAKFPVTVADFDISIPAVVRENIAKEVEVTVNLAYDQFNR